jgi:peroxiredoxin
MEALMNADLYGYLAAAIAAASGARWLWLMQQVRIPKDRSFFIGASVASALLGMAGLLSGPSMAGGIAAGVSVVSNALFLVLCAMSRQATPTPAVSVGAAIVPFTAVDDEGRTFNLGDLRGRPFLLKFFRGHWCPYCVAELRRWNELLPELDARGIGIVTICSDLPEQIRKGRRKHGLRSVMLSDPELAITDLYNLRNPKSLAPKPGVVIALPIPTTILVDAGGIVRWIDQASDYMQRSDPPRVLAAIRSAFGERLEHEPPRRETSQPYESGALPGCSLPPDIQTAHGS